MDLLTAPRTFLAGDYAVFAIMLFLSTLIGFFYAIKDRKKQSTEEYLLAGRSMNPYPVAFSLSVSFLSAVTVLGTPAEVYDYGTMYIWTLVGYFIASVITAEIYIPVYFNSELSSVYQYLEQRFHRAVRIVATLIYLVQTVLYVGVVIYAPALALNAVTGLDLWAAAASTAVICIIYSTLGGLKAVIWTDALQMIIMVVGFISVLIQTSIKGGGIENLWRKAEEGGRIEFLKFDLDPRIRHTFWTVAVGSTFLNLALYAVNQGQVQRYLSCASIKDAKKAVMVNYVGIFILNWLAVLCGVVMYGYYHNCDPVSQEQAHVARSDQLMPFMVLELFRNAPGVPGLFIAAVYSGSLSTVSTAITALASVTVQDFLKPFFDWKDTTFTWISRGLVFFFGLLCLLFAFLTSQLGGILQVAISVLGLAGAPLVVVFTLGVLFPFANTWGALSGMFAATFGTVWIFIGRIAYPVPPEFTNRLPLSTSECPVFNTSNIMMGNLTNNLIPETFTTSAAISTAAYNATEIVSRPPVADLYAISYLYLTGFGFSFGMVFGIIVSLLTGGWKRRKTVDSVLLHPFFDHWIFCCLPKKCKRMSWCGFKA